MEGFWSCTEEEGATRPQCKEAERQTATQEHFLGICKVLSSLSRKQTFSIPISVAWLRLYVDGRSSRGP